MCYREKISRIMQKSYFKYIIFLLVFTTLIFFCPFNAVLAKEKSNDCINTSNSGQKKYIILSIDGGGIRGIIPARILQEIEERTGHRIHQMVDTISGNSTGGIIALGLVTPNTTKTGVQYKAEDLLKLYTDNAAQIFPHSLLHKIKTGFGLWGTKYPREPLDKLLREKFNNNKLSQALKHCVIFSYSLNKRMGHIWTSIDTGEDFYMRDIAAATSAAPVYFPPAIINNVDGKYCYGKSKLGSCTEVDGGLFANDPSIMTVASILQQSTQKQRNTKLRREDLILISLGTGMITQTEEVNVRGGGSINWLIDADIIDIILDITSGVSRWTASALGVEYHKIQVELTPQQAKMDNISSKNIQMLINKAEEYIRQHDKEINTICEILKKNL